MRKNEEEQGAVLVKAMMRVILGSVAGLIICLLLLLLFSVAISAGLFSEGVMFQLTILACVAGGFGGGLWTAKGVRARKLILGLATGAVLFLLLLTIGVLFFDNVSPGEEGLGLLIGCLCGGGVAGLLRPRSRNKRRAR